ncbi:alpha/beta fold hydrolase [Streptomyces sp. NBC_00249]|uniref:thioesterase II family protein n=1 Tax=Streptomyces sp. NBC_00249 TaxID=2975690 RepID=UPI00224E4C15|nr:alpha/beta fold hydrolase [Streptomyces sp. NBC_00249]MCX5193518.1 alpha/beta fold hydrolase [Streptomyces sp. NBC_00249]
MVIPHSGGGPNALLPLVGRLPDSLEVVGVTLPGRERRFAEDPEISPNDLVEGILAELSGLAPMPTVLFGHSLGGSIALALTLADPTVCSALVISAQLPDGSQIERPEEWDDSVLLAVVERGGGTPPGLLDDPAWREHMLRLLRADLTLGGRLARRNAQGRVAHPLTVIGGEQDLLVPAEKLNAWADRADAGLSSYILPGGHFYLMDEANCDIIAAAVAASLERSVPTT